MDSVTQVLTDSGIAGGIGSIFPVIKWLISSDGSLIYHPYDAREFSSRA
jgi:hypothetical protein